jgi:hypothetical protein
MAEHLLNQHQGHVRAILGYGSAIRETATRHDGLLDLYVLTDDHGLPGSALSRMMCRLIPPNVYYAEMDWQGAPLRAKYAVLPLSRFRALMNRKNRNPYFWARFCQPSLLLYARDGQSRQAAVDATCEALRTMFAAARSSANSTDPVDIFAAGFAETYRTEFRPEAEDRARNIALANEIYYRQAAGFLASEPPLNVSWPSTRFTGKLLSLLRLAKAAFTFRGGVDYAAWKIARHTGEAVEVTDWNRRHPVLTGLMLLPKLLRRGNLR